jgi:hypothetical protein
MALEVKSSNACLRQSYIWLHLKVLFLTINMRAVGAENTAYTSWLGNMSVDRTLNRPLQLPSFFQVYSDLSHINHNISPNDRLRQNHDDHTYYPKPALLALINDSLDRLNAHMLGLFDGVTLMTHPPNPLITSCMWNFQVTYPAKGKGQRMSDFYMSVMYFKPYLQFLGSNSYVV